MRYLISTLKLLLLFAYCHSSEALYPKESETREVKPLDGVWNFRILNINQDQNVGFAEKWYLRSLDKSGPVIPMPVPSSFNDITQSREIRDYAGWAWYDREFFAPKNWQTQNTVVKLRFGSAHYTTQVYLNGINVVNHTGGHLPFEADVTNLLKFNETNLLTVALNNTLTSHTLPPGQVNYKTDTTIYPKGFYETSTSFDFFNYAGIHRSVQLYAIPKVHITDISVATSIQSNLTGVIDFNVTYTNENNQKVFMRVHVLDQAQKLVAMSIGDAFSERIVIPNAKLWWPFTMHSDPGYQYTLRISILDFSKTELDVYYQKVGIRTVKVVGTQFLINNQPFYFRGFGKHEDANIRGKGLDFPLIIKDFNLIKWIGANAFRTSHYPYSEELMDQADAQGIAVIDECPAVGLSIFDEIFLAEHKKAIQELINRDKNRPSVVMWSIANEPKSSVSEAGPYFSKIAAFTKSLDSSRPISAACNQEYNNDKMTPSLDVLMINRYYGWYQDTGYSQTIEKHLVTNFDEWHRTHPNKPIMISEYGADTVSGLHTDPPFIFSEDYQTEYLMRHHKAFDELRSKGFFVGELIWNFADFMTNQQITRVIGNKKGIFTRERQPKAAARVLRCRYWSLAGQLTEVANYDSNFYCPAH